MRCFLSFALLLNAGLALAQQAQPLPTDLIHAGYNWDVQRRQRLPISTADAELPAVILKDFTGVEYYYDQRQKSLRTFVTEHRIVRVNTGDGVEAFNKIVVPELRAGGPVEINARTISPRGEVHEVKAADMKELKNEDGQSGYRILAVDGVEKGSEVEYYYTREKRPEYFGSETLQGETPAHNVTFELISPAALTFEARVYHGPAATADTTMSGHHALRLTLKDVAGLRPEAFAFPAAQQLRVEYKLAYVANQGQVRQFTWADAGRYLHGIMTAQTKDDAKVVAKVLDAAKVPASAPVAERIAAMENYIKLNFNLEENTDNSLPKMLATHNAPEDGLTHLMVLLYRKLGIEPEVVVTSSRDKRPFDGTFDTWGYLDHYALYFPATDKYLAPGRPDCRYGMLPSDWTGIDGLFVRSVKLGTTESGIGTVKPITALPAEMSPQNLDISVRFAPDLTNSTLNVRQTLGGYPAASIQPFWSMIPADKRTELLQTLQKSVAADAVNFRNLEAHNVERGINSLEKPFIVEGEMESAALLDKAGPRYLFKIGTLLGPQTELYQKEERQFDMENDNNHGYLRVIRFEVPAGYAVRNLNDLNMDVKAGPDAAKPVFDFHSGYTQQGQTVTVTVSENYRQLRWPKADFEAFRAVVNAAANFNKVVLVLDKKS